MTARAPWTRLLLRGLVVLLVDAAALLALDAVLDGFELAGVAAAIATAALAGLLNAFVWPLLASVTLPLSVVTLGIAGLVLNGALVALAANAVPGAQIAGLGVGVVLALGLAALTAVLSALLAIDDDESWQRNVVGRQARRRGERHEPPQGRRGCGPRCATTRGSASCSCARSGGARSRPSGPTPRRTWRDGPLQQHLLGRDRRSGGVRGAGGLARRPGRRAVLCVRALPGHLQCHAA